MLSRVEPEASVLERAQSLIGPSFNWGPFTEYSIAQGTSAIIYKNLLKLKNVPQSIIDKFRNIYHGTLRENILKVSELDRLIEILNREGIEVISLKGATASENIFGDIGVYPSSDIDILVKVEDIDRVRGILEADGYILNDAGFDEYREYFMKEQYHINLTKGSFTIEPHWNLFMMYFTAPPEFWWEESVIVSSGGKTYRFLSPEKNILYTSFRLFSIRFVQLRFLVIVAEIIKHYGDRIDWNKLFMYARRYKFENVLRVTMKLCNELLGMPVMPEYIRLSRSRTQVLYRRAYNMALRGEDVYVFNNALFALLRDDLTGALGVIGHRLFPPMGEIVSRYGLHAGSNKAIIYYILNPLFLALRKKQKG